MNLSQSEIPDLATKVTKERDSRKEDSGTTGVQLLSTWVTGGAMEEDIMDMGTTVVMEDMAMEDMDMVDMVMAMVEAMDMAMGAIMEADTTAVDTEAGDGISLKNTYTTINQSSHQEDHHW